MSLLSSVASGQGFGQEASSIQFRGMDGVMRKGGAGIAADHAHMSKPATIRTIQDGFNINNVSNVDLILRRKSPPSAEHMRQNSAGTLASERRGPDFPAVVRQTSIEHAGSRRHSPPPARQQRGQENLMMKLATVTEDANRIGRDSKSRHRSQSRKRSSSPRGSPRARSAKGVRSLSPRRTTMLSVFMPEPALATEFSSCTWGESHAFDGVLAMEVNQEAIIMCNQDIALDNDGLLKGRSYSGWGSDDGRSTTTGGSSPRRMSSFVSECSTPTSLAGAFSYSSPEDTKHCMKTMFEDRMKALVKAEQKKAMRKFG